jgi:hypothetical protein
MDGILRKSRKSSRNWSKISEREIKRITSSKVCVPAKNLAFVEFIFFKLNGLYLVKKNINIKFDIIIVKRLRKLIKDVLTWELDGITKTIKDTTII